MNSANDNSTPPSGILQRNMVLAPLDVLYNRLRVRVTVASGRLQVQGRPGKFSLRSEESLKGSPMVFKVDFNLPNPSSGIVRHSKPMGKQGRLYVRAGMIPIYPGSRRLSTAPAV